MAETSSRKSSADDLKKLAMKVFEDATKDCEDEELKRVFRTVGSCYDSLNNWAVQMFSFMADIGHTDNAREMFKPFSDLGILSEVAVFTIVITIYSGSRKAESALKVYHHMIASGFNPVSYTYTQLICVLSTDFSKAKYLRYAKRFFLELLDKGMKLKRTPFWDVLKAIAYREPLDKFKEFIEQLKARGFILHDNGFYYNEAYLAEARETLKMQAHLVHNHTVDEDVRKYFFMKSAFPGHIQKLSNKMYTALIVDGNLEEAAKFKNEIEEKHVEPMVVIHTSIIKAYLKFDKTKGALGAYLAMLAAGVSPNSVTYTVLIKGLSADPNFIGDAKKYLLEMMDKGKRPNAASFTAVIEGFAKQEDKAAEEEGKECVRVMMDKGFVPNAKAMMEVLRGRPTAVIRRAMSIVLSTLKQ
ncbi:PREDICTED: pentatricopeptide repeat-containing protein At1g06710, mitochondrial-like [Fragaria vesca subsp. vesca]|uniref:pentatricopeptide repeat-containing protein At1g06710, mitochondrial-like n=1 Tax=Fragaria vesca subsp. vesca TaxID=101020 RepID=UPI0002C3691B|nr:PREDICTED: pentatricopeptide repeat-containing protein At1g06710, mitochondrial-like [Fragaria vesca subsp. vesca]